MSPPPVPAVGGSAPPRSRTPARLVGAGGAAGDSRTAPAPEGAGRGCPRLREGRCSPRGVPRGGCPGPRCRLCAELAAPAAGAELAPPPPGPGQTSAVRPGAASGPALRRPPAVAGPCVPLAVLLQHQQVNTSQRSSDALGPPRSPGEGRSGAWADPRPRGCSTHPPHKRIYRGPQRPRRPRQLGDTKRVPPPAPAQGWLSMGLRGPPNWCPPPGSCSAQPPARRETPRVQTEPPGHNLGFVGASPALGGQTDSCTPPPPAETALAPLWVPAVEGGPAAPMVQQRGALWDPPQAAGPGLGALPGAGRGQDEAGGGQSAPRAQTPLATSC